MSEGPLPAFGLIQPENIPGRTIDVGQIQDAAQLLDTKAHAIRVQGALVESEWDGLAGVYDAPEAPDLFLLMKGERGVGTRTDALATNFSKAASALTTLSYAIASTVQELKDLHAEALEFRGTIQNGLVEATGFGKTIHESAETTGHIPWADHPPTNARNTELIQAVNAGVAKLDAAQADAVNAINALDATVAGTFAAPYTPVSLDGLNVPGVPSGWGPSRVPESCSYENVRNAGIGWVEGNVVGVSSLFGLDPFSLEFTADAGAAWSGLGMTAAGLALFATPAGWAVQAALGRVKAEGQELPAPVRALDDFVNGAGDHIAAVVSGFLQVETWKNDPGKAATTFGLNAATVLMPTGVGGAALRGVASTVKVGALVERLEAIGAKIGGPTGDAFTAGIRATAAGSVEAFNAVKAILDAPDVLAREALAAAKKALAEIAAHIPTFEPSLDGIDNGHLNNQSVEEATSGTVGGSSGSSSGSGHGGSSSTGYDPNNYNPDGSIRDPDFGEISPERRTELLEQQAAHGAGATGNDGNGPSLSTEGQSDHSPWEVGNSDGHPDAVDSHDGPPALEAGGPNPHQERIDHYQEMIDSGSYPSWLTTMFKGTIFNIENWPRYDANEIYLDIGGGKRSIVDSLNIGDGGEVISRKNTQLGEVRPATALRYLDEFVRKYEVNNSRITIADTPGNRASLPPGMIGTSLDGEMILEVPVQTSSIPEEILAQAGARGIQIRDVAGRIYNPNHE